MPEETTLLYCLKSLRLSTPTNPVYLGYCTVAPESKKLFFELNDVKFFPRFAGYFDKGEPKDTDTIIIERMDKLPDGSLDPHPIQRFHFGEVALEDLSLDNAKKALLDESSEDDDEDQYAAEREQSSGQGEEDDEHSAYQAVDWVAMIRSRDAPFMFRDDRSDWTFHLEPIHEPPSINLLSVLFVMRKKT